MQTIGLTCRRKLESKKALFQRIVKHLEKRGIDVYLEDRVAEVLEVKSYKELKLGKTKVDLILVLGGDGTILRVVSQMNDHFPAFFGINLGNLGFLAEVPPVRIAQTLDRILMGKTTQDKRRLLDIRLEREGELIHQFHALNEVSITQGTLSRVIHLRTKVDGKKLTNYQADGLLVATPTGSTAYSLSAGGPIVYPSIPALILTPVCASSFSQKPIVIPNTKKIDISVESDYEQINLTVDGQKQVDLNYKDRIRIQAGGEMSFLRLLDEHYFTNLRDKLGWGERR